MASVLFLPSTPLNILVSAALACHLRQAQGADFRAELWLIDQKTLDNNPYIHALAHWAESPFQKVKIMPGQAKGRAKLKERQNNFKRIQQGLAQFQPSIIATGSDRRIEFQYAMHQLKKHQPAAQGWYLDDGLYSYAGRPYHPIKDGINNLIKKLSYGLWWQEPKTVGASNWINQAWLFRPQQVHPSLANKVQEPLISEWFKADDIQVFSQALSNQFNFEASSLKDVDYVFIIPHPNNQLKMKGYASRIQSVVAELVTQKQRIAIKYHPRQQGDDALGLAKVESVSLIPTNLAFEFILPLLPMGAKVVGDVGTSLLTTKWLRDDLYPIAVLNPQDTFQERFVTLFKQNDIQVIESYAMLLNQSD